MRRPRAGAAPALLLGLLLAASAAAQDSADPERAQAERQLHEVLAQIERLGGALLAARREHRAEQSRLRELDLALQRADRAYRALENERREHQARLTELDRQRREFIATLDDRTARLANQLRAAYRSGRQSRSRLILNLDDPEIVTRMLAYYDYVNRAQLGRIAELRDAVTTLDRLANETGLELERLAEVQREQQSLRDELAAQRGQRAELLARIANDIEQNQSSLRELERDRKDLEALIERLADVLADIPLDLDQRAGFASRKGRLPMPLNGPVRHAFGQTRAAGLRWQGWLIGADTGAEVHAIGYGRVAFADWLRGYGLLLIIDHGQGFMSLYGHNESLLQDAGAWVEAGEVIGVVGGNSGTTQGLYFELRRNGKAIDPAAWIDRRRAP
ncbi:MAG: peptidoglycan DD-metalloendopeptidase family protein [Xanthomonadales bacterium]